MNIKPEKTIDVQEWMIAPETATIMAALNANGQDALFVGGCVRNALLGTNVCDLDIATKHHPQSVIEILTAVGAKVIPTGIDHGTVTAVVAGKSFEITTLRKDVETDGRRAVVAFTDDWTQDSYRRDFTMNTLLADAQGHVYDPTGQGLQDLEARHVRFIGEATQRIAEDHLRILRFFRFHALYGVGEPDAQALAACRAAADKISALSKERITQEFFKIISVKDPVSALGLMFGAGVLKSFEFNDYDPKTLKSLCEFQSRYGLESSAARLLALAGLRLDNITAMNEHLLTSKAFSKDVQAIAQVLGFDDLSEDMAVKIAVYKYGRAPTAQALMIELSNGRVINGYAPEALDIIQNWDIPNFPVSGTDLMAAGMKQGAALGQKLAALENEWINGGFKSSKEQCLENFTI